MRLIGSTTEWASTWTTYDGAGRKKTVSVPTQTTGTSSDQPANIPVTAWTHDVLGRPLSETRPDATTSTWTHRRQPRDRPVYRRRETIDRDLQWLRQLTEVRQKRSPARRHHHGLLLRRGGRLTSVGMKAPDGVLQSRKFDHDGRGFLRWESQPESEWRPTHTIHGDTFWRRTRAPQTRNSI
jgi:YD repeat-containing protein